MTAPALPMLVQVGGFSWTEHSTTNAAGEPKYLLTGFDFLYRHRSAAPVLVKNIGSSPPATGAIPRMSRASLSV
jgi:hypothetical protein